MTSRPSMPPEGGESFTAFLGHRRIATGSKAVIARAAKRAVAKAPAAATLLVFDDSSGEQVDLDLRAAAAAPRDAAAAEPAPRAAGRPKLGVVAREVTLLPRHWEWLSLQPGGSSVTLRRLVDEARRASASRDAVRAAQERCYRFLQAIAGNLPGYEEALRSLYRSDTEAFEAAAQRWPADIHAHARALAAEAFEKNR